MGTKLYRRIATLRGVGAVRQESTILANVEYFVYVDQEVMQIYNREGMREIPADKIIRGTLKVLDNGVLELDEPLALRMSDGRDLTFIVKQRNLVGQRLYEIYGYADSRFWDNS